MAETVGGIQENTEMLQTWLPKELSESFGLIAEAHELSKSSLALKIIREYVDTVDQDAMIKLIEDKAAERIARLISQQ